MARELRVKRPGRKLTPGVNVTLFPSFYLTHCKHVSDVMLRGVTLPSRPCLAPYHGIYYANLRRGCPLPIFVRLILICNSGYAGRTFLPDCLSVGIQAVLHSITLGTSHLGTYYDIMTLLEQPSGMLSYVSFRRTPSWSVGRVHPQILNGYLSTLLRSPIRDPY